MVFNRARKARTCVPDPSDWEGDLAAINIIFYLIIKGLYIYFIFYILL